MERAEKHMWTKEEITRLLDLWDTHSLEGMAEVLGLNVSQVKAMANRLRTLGFVLSRKRTTGVIEALLKELAGERGITLKK